MSTKYGRNFTNFQNIGLQGSGTTSPTGVGMIEMAPGATQAASTLSIAMIGSGTVASENSANEHPYFHISNAGLSLGTGFIRLSAVGSSPYTTIRARTSTYLDTDVALTLPAKSGGIPICGTFTLHLPAITAGNFASTNVVIAGIRAEDLFLCQFMTPSETAITSDRGRAFLSGALPTNTGVNLTFFNPTATATVYGAHTMAYVAFR